MSSDYDTLIAHLKRSGRLKLLPRILRELRMQQAREVSRELSRETALENPSLIFGWREIRDGVLTDTTGKRALIDIYQRVTKA